jgi:ferredoxin
MWTKLMNNPRKRAPKRIAVIDPESCFGAFACSICQAACPVEDCIVEEKDADDRWVCAVRVDKCIGCGLCVTLGNTTAPQPRDFGCPADYDAINMHDWDDVVDVLEASAEDQPEADAVTVSETGT